MQVSRINLLFTDFEEDGFGSSPWFFAFVAERDGVAVGMVMGNREWGGTRKHYLQSLYVRPNARRCGVADLLIKEFCKVRTYASSKIKQLSNILHSIAISFCPWQNLRPRFVILL